MKQQPVEKKETPQERLKRIMSRQLNKQSTWVMVEKAIVVLCVGSSYNLIMKLFAFSVKKDTAAEIAKKREQERQRLEKLAETSRLSRSRRRSRSRSYSRSPPR